MTFEELRNRWGWKPIRGCPGRYVLPGTEFNGAPNDLLGAQAKVDEFRVDAAKDPVVVARLAQGGGLISYIQATKVAVLLLSPAFLASDFIASEEVPQLLLAAEQEGAVILPIVVKPCAIDRVKALSRFQCVNSPSRTLIEMAEGEQERFLLKLTEDVLRALEAGG